MDCAIGSSVDYVSFGSFLAASERLPSLMVLDGEGISAAMLGWPPFNYSAKTYKFAPASPFTTSVIPPAFYRTCTELKIGSFSVFSCSRMASYLP